MELIMNVYNTVAGNWAEIAKAIAYVIAAATVIVKITPTLKDDNYLKAAVKFLGKYIALNK